MSEQVKSFSCVLCGCKLESKEALQEHFRKHANKEIDAKGNSAKPSSAKVKEEKSKIVESSTDKPKVKISCDVCPMEFDTVTIAIQHKFRKHPTSSKKYFCPFCGMQFPLKFTKDRHLETHKEIPPATSLPCSECGTSFYSNQALNYHFKSTHKKIMSIFKPVPTPPPSKKIKINNANEAQSVYYCYLCGKEYIIKFNLQKHLELLHSDEERDKVPENLIKCTTCDALFYNKKAYDNHNMYHKPDDLYVTSEEQRLQTVTRVDQDFDIRRVQLAADKFLAFKKRRRSAVTTKSSTKKHHDKKQVTDDELSPTSSIESSDSENDVIEIAKKPNNNSNIDKTKDNQNIKNNTTNSTNIQQVNSSKNCQNNQNSNATNITVSNSE